MNRSLNLYRLKVPLISDPNLWFIRNLHLLPVSPATCPPTLYLFPSILTVILSSPLFHSDDNGYRRVFRLTQANPSLPTQKAQSSGPTRVDSEPLLNSEIQEIGEEEFLNNVQQCRDLASTASKLRLPKSIRKDCDTMIQHIEELCRGEFCFFLSVFNHISESPPMMSRIPEDQRTPNGRVS